MPPPLSARPPIMRCCCELYQIRLLHNVNCLFVLFFFSLSASPRLHAPSIALSFSAVCLLRIHVDERLDLVYSLSIPGDFVVARQFICPSDASDGFLAGLICCDAKVWYLPVLLSCLAREQCQKRGKMGPGCRKNCNSAADKWSSEFVHRVAPCLL